jgi:hypothetical protein
MLVAGLAGTLLALPLAGSASAAITEVSRSHDNLTDRTDADGNGYPDLGEVVTGQEWQTVEYPTAGSTCEYFLNYRGEFDNDRYQDSGWIQNVVTCTGGDYEGGPWTFLIVHESDPRFTGEGTAVWNEWEYHVQVEPGIGNLEVLRPERP